MRRYTLNEMTDFFIAGLMIIMLVVVMNLNGMTSLERIAYASMVLVFVLRAWLVYRASVFVVFATCALGVVSAVLNLWAGQILLTAIMALITATTFVRFHPKAKAAATPAPVDAHAPTGPPVVPHHHVVRHVHPEHQTGTGKP